MIIDKLTNAALYYKVNKRIQEGFNYLINTDFATIKPGKYEIDGSKIFALVNQYQTKENDQNIVEAHKKYIDLQYISEGNEIIEFETFNHQKIVNAYDSENDYLLYTPHNTAKLKLSEKMFAVFFPEDLHLPGLIEDKPKSVKKIVVKILID